MQTGPAMSAGGITIGLAATSVGLAAFGAAEAAAQDAGKGKAVKHFVLRFSAMFQ